MRASAVKFPCIDALGNGLAAPGHCVVLCCALVPMCRRVDLSGNQLSGSIPSSISALTALTYVVVDVWRTGTLTVWCYCCTRLWERIACFPKGNDRPCCRGVLCAGVCRALDLSANLLSRGTIPSGISALAHLLYVCVKMVTSVPSRNRICGGG